MKKIIMLAFSLLSVLSVHCSDKNSPDCFAQSALKNTREYYSIFNESQDVLPRRKYAIKDNYLVTLSLASFRFFSAALSVVCCDKEQLSEAWYNCDSSQKYFIAGKPIKDACVSFVKEFKRKPDTKIVATYVHTIITVMKELAESKFIYQSEELNYKWLEIIRCKIIELLGESEKVQTGFYGASYHLKRDRFLIKINHHVYEVYTGTHLIKDISKIEMKHYFE